MPKTQLTRLAVTLYATDLLLLAAYAICVFWVVPDPIIFRLLNLDGEASLSAWFSASQLLLTGVVFAGAACYANSASVRPLFFVSCSMAFIFLSADEAASIHEKITALGKGVNYFPRFSGGHGLWIPIYLLAGALFFAITHRSWRRLWHERREGMVVFLTGVVMFVLGAVVFEIASYGDLREASNRGIYVYQVLVEEAFELLGVTTILVGGIKMFFESR